MNDSETEDQRADGEAQAGASNDASPRDGGPPSALAQAGAEFGAAPERLPFADEDADEDALIVNIEGFEGPLDVLLALARSQKVDLRKISILQLVEQYLEFVEIVKSRRLELAADYLVMAAWLAYLKSRLLLPEQESDDEPTGEEMAALLAFRLAQLEAMREAGHALMDRPQLNRDVFPRGAPEGVRDVAKHQWEADLYDLLKAYSHSRVRNVNVAYRPPAPPVYSLEMARLRLEAMLGVAVEWADLEAFLPPMEQVRAPRRSLRASTFSAALEMVKNGRLELRQWRPFGAIYVRKRATGERDAMMNAGFPDQDIQGQEE